MTSSTGIVSPLPHLERAHGVRRWLIEPLAVIAAFVGGIVGSLLLLVASLGLLTGVAWLVLAPLLEGSR